MSSWIYLFSKFTSEALLFELFGIFGLLLLYSAFWILKKRRFGALGQTVPSGPVKVYLNELIRSTEQIRLQLFGLLANQPAGASPSPETLASLTAVSPSSSSPTASNDLPKRVQELEAQLAQQLKTVDGLRADKTNLEKSLADVQNRSTTAASSKPKKDDQVELNKLQTRVQELESKLAEYNVIEDDLANLKRLQAENAELKANLADGKSTSPATGASSALEEISEGTLADAPLGDLEIPGQDPANASNSKGTDDDLINEFQKIMKD